MCPALCDPMDYIVHGILQARILEWVAVSFSRGSSLISCMGRQILYHWATCKAPVLYTSLSKKFTCMLISFPYSSVGKESSCNVGDLGSIPGLGRSPGEGKGYLLQYSGLENSMDYIVHGVTKSRTWLSNFHFSCKAFFLVKFHYKLRVHWQQKLFLFLCLA